MGYVPTELVDIAVVEAVGMTSSTLVFSPFTNPEKIPENGGSEYPYDLLVSFIVRVNGALVMVNVPFT